MRVFSLLFFALASVALADDSWPQFRGPTGQGIANGGSPPLSWSETENVAWKTAVPGRGWSSPVVLDGQVWLTTAIETAADEEQRKKKLADDPFANQLALAAEVVFRAVCVNLATGSIEHDVELFRTNEPDAIHATNSYASPTPIVERGRVYCHFGTYGTAAIDTRSGEVVWRRQFRIQHNVGAGSSPVLYRNLVILTCDGVNAQYVTALDKHTGETVWRTDRPPLAGDDGDHHKAFATPLLIHAAGRDQLISPGAQWFVSYDPASGETIWQINHGRGFSNVARPVFGNALVYICTGFMGHELWAIRPDGQGDVSESHVAWRESKQMPDQPSPLLVDGELYVVSSRGVASSFDALSGKLLWRERIAGNYSASPLFAAGRVHFFSREGKTTVLAAGPSFKPLAESQIDGRQLATPAIVGDAILLRSDTHLYRIEER